MSTTLPPIIWRTITVYFFGKTTHISYWKSAFSGYFKFKNSTIILYQIYSVFTTWSTTAHNMKYLWNTTLKSNLILKMWGANLTAVAVPRDNAHNNDNALFIQYHYIQMFWCSHVSLPFQYNGHLCLINSYRKDRKHHVSVLV